MDAVMTDINGGNAADAESVVRATELPATRDIPNLDHRQLQSLESLTEAVTEESSTEVVESLKQAIYIQQQQTVVEETEENKNEVVFHPVQVHEEPMDTEDVGDCVERALAEIDGIASDNFNGDHHQFLQHNNKNSVAEQLDNLSSMKRELSSPESADALSPKRGRYGGRRSLNRSNNAHHQQLQQQQTNTEEDIRKTLESDDDPTPEPIVKNDLDGVLFENELKVEDGDDEQGPLKGFNLEEHLKLESNIELMKKIITEAETGLISQESVPTPPPALPIPEPIIPEFEPSTPVQTPKMGKRRGKSSWKNMKNADSMIEEPEDQYQNVTMDNTTDSSSEDQKLVMDCEDYGTPLDNTSIKSEMSAESSVSGKSRKSRGSRGASPSIYLSASAKKTDKATNPMYREPFRHGWKRELVFRATGSDSNKKLGDVYYYTPTGKKLRSSREISDYLNRNNAHGLTRDHFSFHKEPIGLDDEAFEIIRDAKKPKDGAGIKAFTAKGIKASFKETPIKKSTPPKKLERSLLATPPAPPKHSPKHGKSSSAIKVKLPPSKKGTPKREIRSPPVPTPVPVPVPEPEVSSSPMWNQHSPTRRSQTAIVEKSPLIKTKRLTKDEIQDSCSIKCPRNIGQIPSLECKVCLRLYHPECTRIVNLVSDNSFICQDCQPQSDPTIIPPPLIPISMLESPTSSNAKSQQPLSYLPKLQRIPKDGTSNGSSLESKDSVDRTDASWFSPLENEFLQRHGDGSPPKPAQNIAVMNGRRYIVVPKNNLMAVQPAIPSKLDNKTLDKLPPIPRLDECITKSEETKEKLEEQLIKTTPIEKEETPEQVLEEPTKNLQENNLEEKDVDNPVDHTMPPLDENNPEIEPLSLNCPTIKRRKQAHLEHDQRQNFMLSLCTGYDALYRIFQYLKVQELLRASRVCRMWRDLASHPGLWKTVRMKNSQVTDWDGFAETLSNKGTKHLDLRKMLIVGEANNIWTQFVNVIPRVKSLVKLELCRCPASVVEEITQNCPQLEVLCAISIKADTLNIKAMSNLSNCTELRLKALNGMSLEGDLTALENMKNLTHLTLTSIKELGKKNIEVLQNLQNLETLELGECTDLPERFGSLVLMKLKKLERLRLEKGEGHCCTFDILENISKLEKLIQLELVNFDVKTGFDNYLAACKNMKKLLVIPTYICQSATSNNMVLGGVTKLSSNLSHFIWGVTQELLRVTEIFRDQCNQSSDQIKVDSIPVLKPVPCYDLIKNMQNDGKDSKDDKPPTVSNPQIEILPLPSLQKLLITALPKTRVKILKIPYHATWRQSFNENSNVF